MRPTVLAADRRNRAAGAAELCHGTAKMPSLADPTLAIALIVAAGIGAHIASERLGIPAILPLLVIGFLAGPISGLLDPDALFGDLLFPAVSLGVGLILFEGALTLRLSDIRGAGRIVARLISVGVLVTVAVAAAAAHLALGLDWRLALLFGAIVSVSGPTVIVPLLRSVRPSERLGRILHWEGILVDPIGAALAVIVFEAILAGADAPDRPVVHLLGLVASGIGIGALAGIALAEVLKRHLLPDFLRDVATLAAVLLVYALADSVADEAGLVAVTAMGMTLANIPGVPREEILDFKESLSVLIISVLFIVLAARVDLAAFAMLGPNIAAVLAAVLVLARPLAALAATLSTDLAWRERGLLGWLMPRGIVAAAVSALFGYRLEQAGIAGAELLVPLTFSVIVATVVIHSLTGRPLAKLLQVAMPEASGVLIVGGNPVARAFAEALQNLGVKVVLADASYHQVRLARMAGIPTFLGSPVSEHADRQLDLVGIGMMLALSRQPSLNALACMRYRAEFGSGNVYTIRREESAIDPDSESVPFSFRGRWLFDSAMTLDRLERELAADKRIRVASITQAYTIEDLLARIGDESALLFAVDPDGLVYPLSENISFRIGPGWRLGYLGQDEEAAARGETPSQQGSRQ